MVSGLPYLHLHEHKIMPEFSKLFAQVSIEHKDFVIPFGLADQDSGLKVVEAGSEVMEESQILRYNCDPELFYDGVQLYKKIVLSLQSRKLC